MAHNMTPIWDMMWLPLNYSGIASTFAGGYWIFVGVVEVFGPKVCLAECGDSWLKFLRFRA